MTDPRILAHDLFREALARLNPRQQEAVSHIEGPVLVIAGPGTGKTQILAARIGHILLETDTQPHNILCLTYTDNGRLEMRNRLFAFIGAAAYRVPIHTFHSFCNEVIQDHLSYFGKLNLEAISELEEIELFRNLVDGLGPDNPLKRYKADAYFEIPRLKSLFSRMKKEAWEPDFLHQRIAAYVAELPSRDGFFYKRKYKTFQAGDPRSEKIADETERMHKLVAAVDLYPVYQQMMRAAGRYTFDDMIIWVLKAFKDNPSLLLDYQERYLYFMVDEFQDTSGSQNLLLQQLTSYWAPPNVFVVGDDDQSIFSFQDANVENILRFADRYAEDLCRIVLTDNYRSTQAILDTARVLIENNRERISAEDPSLDKHLISANPALQMSEAKPLIFEYPNAVQESACVTEKIKALLDRGVPPEEIAVIYRNHKQADLLGEGLTKQDIPMHMRRSVNLLELPLVRNILQILAYIAAEHETPYSGDERLFEILHYDFFGVPPIEIAKVSVGVFQRNFKGQGEKYSIRRAIQEQPAQAPDLFSPGGQSELQAAGRILEDLIGKASNLTVQGLLEEVLQEAGVLKLVMRSPEKIWLLQVLNTLFEFVKSETKKNPEGGIPQLLDTVRLMNDNKLAIPLQKVVTTEQGVSMLTAHAAKGSEFSHVFLIGCSEKIWDGGTGGGTQQYKLPDNLMDKPSQGSELEEARRLFYVAMTRAKTNLEISYPAHDEQGKGQARSSFVSEILDGTSGEVVLQQADETQLGIYLGLQFSVGMAPEIALIDKTYIDQLLKRYSLSVTHLNNYLSCPIKFYYQSLVRVPGAKSESMTFGSAVHFALQRLFEKMKRNHQIFPGGEDMLEDFSWYMHRNRESFTRDQFARRMEYGKKILPAYYDYYVDRWVKDVEVEWNVRHVAVAGVPINGKLDKIEKIGQAVNVVDYKTGKFENARKKLLPPSEKDPLGGDYWRQAVFYKILLDNDRMANCRVDSAEFDFVEPVKDHYHTEKLIITPEDVAVVMAQIQQVWESIQRHEFHRGCGKEDCHWCNFVKENRFHVALHALEEEE